eukprot:6283175-Prymnesium_polylepis.1
MKVADKELRGLAGDLQMLGAELDTLSADHKRLMEQASAATPRADLAARAAPRPLPHFQCRPLASRAPAGCIARVR